MKSITDNGEAVNLRQAGLRIIAEMISPAAADSMRKPGSPQQFGGFFDELAVTDVYGTLWARSGLDRRARSIATVAMLIALRAEDELAVHVPAAIRNGVTIGEVEEVIYHASAYAGFPAASSARTTALAALRAAKMLD